MNDWHIDAGLVRARQAERIAAADQARLAAAAAGERRGVRLQVRLDLQVSFGRPGPAPQPLR